jgi:hypothetical protein
MWLFNGSINNISVILRRLVLLVEETKVSGEKIEHFNIFTYMYMYASLHFEIGLFYMRSIQSNAKPGNTAKKIMKIHVPKG